MFQAKIGPAKKITMNRAKTFVIAQLMLVNGLVSFHSNFIGYSLLTHDDGGNYKSAMSYLSSWEGIVNTIMRNNNRWVYVWLLFVTNLLGLHVSAAHVLGDDVTASGSSYNFIAIDLPTPAGLLGFTTLADINEKGEITGGFTDSNLGPFGFFLDEKMRPSDIRCSKAVVSTTPQSINKHGEIAGFATVVMDNVETPKTPFGIATIRISGFFVTRTGNAPFSIFLVQT